MRDTDLIEFDLGKYIEILFRQWQIILVMVLLFSVFAFLPTLRKHNIYQAKVIVASTKLASVVSLGSTIETLSEAQIDPKSISSDARLQSYVLMANNPKIAEAVIEALGKKLPESDRNATKLLNRVSATIAPKSDSIEITVNHPDPDIAALIANAWGETYVEMVNEVYSGSGYSATYQATAQEKDNTFKDYQAAQTALANFLNNNQINELTRKVDETSALIDNLSLANQYAASTIITNTVAAQVSTYNERLLNLQEQLTEAYQESRKIDKILANAQDMRNQVQVGGEGAAKSNAFALMLLKSQVFASNDEGVGNIQIQTSQADISPENMLADLDSLIQILETRRSALYSNIQDISSQLLANGTGTAGLGVNTDNPSLSTLPFDAKSAMQSFFALNGLNGVFSDGDQVSSLDQTLQTLETRLNKLQSELSQENDKKQELVRARDLAWDTYSNLATKAAELKVSAQTKGTEVALASPAAIPSHPNANQKPVVPLAALAGLIFGAFLVFIIEFWWSYKGIKPWPITVSSIINKRYKRDQSNISE